MAMAQYNIKMAIWRQRQWQWRMAFHAKWRRVMKSSINESGSSSGVACGENNGSQRGENESVAAWRRRQRHERK